MGLVEGQECCSLSGSYSLLQTNGDHSCLDAEAGNSFIVLPSRRKDINLPEQHKKRLNLPVLKSKEVKADKNRILSLQGLITYVMMKNIEQSCCRVC